MNYPSRVDENAVFNGWNQNPAPLVIDAQRHRQYKHEADHRKEVSPSIVQKPPDGVENIEMTSLSQEASAVESLGVEKVGGENDGVVEEAVRARSKSPAAQSGASNGGGRDPWRACGNALRRAKDVFFKFAKFMGPGWMVAVAYIDPGNYATDVAAGASYRFQLLVMVLVSNIIAIFLQSLCIKLGSVTGLNLAENCKAHCPPWLNYVLFVFAEAGIIATDMAEVIGTAIALNLLFGLNLVAGCAISIVDVLIILIFYRPSGSMRALRVFEIFVGLLVLGVVVCFCIQLSYIQVPDVGELFRGYLPSNALIQYDGLLQACGILGATVMPHSLYLGSGLVQPRLLEFDQSQKSSTADISTPDNDDSEPRTSEDSTSKYQPSMAAIRYCLKYSIAELAISLFTFALFVNSAILIVSGAALSDSKNAQNASLFGIHELLSKTIAPAAGTIFALALLLSGITAGIVCTIAGQMVWLGQIRMPLKPWLQRLVTRSIAITPSIIVAGCVGKDGVSAALEGTQIALSVILPFVSAPLIYFTCRSRYMAVTDATTGQVVQMKNNWVTATFAVAFWLLIVIMNVASWALNAVEAAKSP